MSQINFSITPLDFQGKENERAAYGEGIVQGVFLGYVRSNLLHSSDLQMGKYNDWGLQWIGVEKLKISFDSGPKDGDEWPRGLSTTQICPPQGAPTH